MTCKENFAELSFSLVPAILEALVFLGEFRAEFRTHWTLYVAGGMRCISWVS